MLSRLHIWKAVGPLVSVLASALAAQDLDITEFLARSGTGLVDEDGERSDWIEVQNLGTTAADIGAWYLTDDPLDLTRWRFPATPIEPGGHVLVFASGKNRADAGHELHASFQLDADGDYLALVRPDGTSIAHEYAPEYPPQREDVSYGISQAVTVTKLLSEDSAATVWIPTSAALNDDWILPAFDDSGWTSARMGVGYDVEDDGADPPPAELVNLALSGTAVQSTTGYGGLAERAIDGNTDGNYGNGSITHTADGDPAPYWEVDLGRVATIQRVVLWNRADCCAGRLSNFRVSLFTDAEEETFSADFFTNGAGFPPPGVGFEVPLPTGTSGRTVRVEILGPNATGQIYLSLAEVQVFAAPDGFRRLIRTDLEASMHGVSASAFIRVPFDVVDPLPSGFLILKLKFDDGFVAYLNGVEVARRHAPAALSWNSAASAERPDAEALRCEEINISSHVGLLAAGPNLLAVHGLNVAADDPDFLILPEIEALSVDSGELRYFDEPTPLASNDSPGLLGFVADTQFSVDRGFFSAPFDVTITTESTGAAIRYSLDGSAPTEQSGTVYSGPIRITTTTTLRAVAFLPGHGPTNVDTQTYVFPAGVVRQSGAGFPASWGGTAADYQMDPNVVNDPRYRDTIQDDISRDIPTLSIVMDNDDLFGPRGIYSNTEARGDAWERPCSMEWIPPGGGDGLQVDCGVRIFGYGWRSHSASLKHAFRLMFKRRYGPAKLEARFFPDFSGERFDSLVLRSQGSRSWNDFRTSIEQTCYIRDAWARYTERDMGKLTTSSTYVHLYLNGLYWGLYNPVERPDAELMTEKLGGDEADYDALNARVGNIEVIDGSRAAWDALVALARSSAVTTIDGYRRVRASLDVQDLADFMLINFYTGNQDWVGSNGNNMRVAGAPGLGVGFKAFSWDMEYSIWNATDNVLGVLTQYDTPAALYERLRLNPEFRLLFADRVRRHLFHGGALTPEKAGERWRARAAEIDRAIVGESARWGDRRREPPYTRDLEWVRERDRLLSSYFPQRTGVLLGQLRQIGLYPAIASPEFQQHGGTIPSGFQVEMTAPAGAILFTLDGTDPRLEGGAVAPGAATYAGPVALSRSAVVKARAKEGSVWSALNEAVFVLDTPPPLRITEVMYHPLAADSPGSFDREDFEFLELVNIGTEPLRLAGFRLQGGIEFAFSSGGVPELEPGGVVLVVENRAAFESRYPGAGMRIAGEYSGQLSNGGELVLLEGPFAETVLDFVYDDAWQPLTDGGGYSLEVVDVLAEPRLWNDASGWRTSRVLGGTPGTHVDAGAEGGLQRPADANQDARVDLSDAVALLGYLFLGSPRVFACGDGSLRSEGNLVLLDTNGDARVDLADAVHLLNHLFLGGSPPVLGLECVRITGCPAACGP